MLMIITGIILILIEIIVPGFGLPGISGIIFLLLGISLKANSIYLSFTYIIIGLILSLLLIFLFIKLTKKNEKLRNIILKNKLDREKGYIPSDDKDYYLGKKGRCLTNLRPSGYIEIEGKRLDALSQVEFIEKGEKIIVDRVEGSKIFVRRI